jgi:hypothetical protein
MEHAGINLLKKKNLQLNEADNAELNATTILASLR